MFSIIILSGIERGLNVSRHQAVQAVKLLGHTVF